MLDNNTPANVIDALCYKSSMKQDVYQNLYSSFQQFKVVIREIVELNQQKVKSADKRIAFECIDKGDFEIQFKFGGDILIFLMHTNIFEFSRDHEVMKTAYIKENIVRSYCGMITIFNFLSDSFTYNRLNDIGYLIGRVFVNRELHYFIEGKREIGLLYNNFQNAIIDRAAIHSIIESAMMYTINFDLLTPPYDSMKEVTVGEMQATLANMPTPTAKRLGFKFNADTDKKV